MKSIDIFFKIYKFEPFVFLLVTFLAVCLHVSIQHTCLCYAYIKNEANLFQQFIDSDKVIDVPI